MHFDQLHQEIIRDHYKNPRGKKSLPHIKGIDNPSCGDHVKIEVQAKDLRIKAIYFDGAGCSIAMCSASMMVEVLCGHTCQEAKYLVRQFISIFQGELPSEKLDKLGDLMVLKGVIQFPVRVKCATLAWHAIDQALDKLLCP